MGLLQERAMLLSKILAAADHPYLFGKGGRKLNNGAGSMQGISIKSLKHHVALQPLFIIIGAGMIFVGAYVTRLAVFGLDVNIKKAKDPAVPLNEWNNHQFKVFNPLGADYSTMSDKRGAPNYEE